MRTTLNIADDVLFTAKELARREGRSTGEVLSDLARKGLLTGHRTGEVTEVRTSYGQKQAFLGFEPLPRRGPAVSNALIDALREEAPD